MWTESPEAAPVELRRENRSLETSERRTEGEDKHGGGQLREHLEFAWRGVRIGIGSYGRTLLQPLECQVLL